MIRIDTLADHVDLFKVLASHVRLELLMLLSLSPGLSIGALADELSVSPASLTLHIRKLEAHGFIYTKMQVTKQGMQKQCFLSENMDRLMITLSEHRTPRTMQHDIPLGHYVDICANPTCGLASTEIIIGSLDDTRQFWNPQRVKAGIIWMKSGYVEYRLPNMLPEGCSPDELSLSFEIASEAPGTQEDWPSDISFYLNRTYIGQWTSPGDYGLVRGRHNPDWWHPQLNQYGLRKKLTINKTGTYMGCEQISDIALDQFAITAQTPLFFRFCSDSHAKNSGGMTLFGRGFGNHNQHLRLTMTYREP